MKGRVFDPASMLDARLAVRGFARTADSQDAGWRRVWQQGCIQTVGLVCERYGAKFSVSISMGVFVERVEKFIAGLMDESVSESDTVGGSFSQIRTESRESGWYLPANELGKSQFELIADDVSGHGVALLDRYSDFEYLVNFCLAEMRSPGSAEFGINHNFQLPAILFLAGRLDSCAESLSIAESRFLERFSPQEAAIRFERHYFFIRRMREELQRARMQ